ncbi:MAG: hypothetical protein DDT30_00804 [Dehalococcoidia bacterium]|nr:hypothetical protein [Bacillota bacterium]
MSKLKRFSSILLVIVFVFSLTSVGLAQEGDVFLEGIVMSEAEIDTFWEQVWLDAEEAVTSEQIAEIQRMRAEEEEFLANLTLESFWETFIYDQPEILELSKYEIQVIKQRIESLYSSIASTVDVKSPLTGAIEAYAWHLSRADGLTNLVVRTALRANGAAASVEASLAFPGQNNRWRRDAFRHYYWNHLCVNDVAVGITQNGRLNSTRIYTTNRELATNILSRNPNLNVDNPTNQQLATALNLRNGLLTNNFNTWLTFFNTARDREDLMDLWNNEMGRVDGVNAGVITIPLLDFNSRWNNNTIIRSNSTVDVTPSRTRQIFNNNWHRPLR